MWKDLNMKEKAAFIRVAVNNGIVDIDDIANRYNEIIADREDTLSSPKETESIDNDTSYIYAKGGRKSRGNPNAARALQFFMNKGLTKQQAAGIVGNFMVESGMNASAVNPYSGAYGIAQWLGGRKKALFKRYGNKPSLDQQLAFVWDELNSSHSNGLKMIRQSKNVSDAAANAFGYYEFSAGPQAAVRAMNASGMNTKWKNPNGTKRLNQGIKNANILLGMNPNYNPAYNIPPISTTINLQSPINLPIDNEPIEIPQLKFGVATSDEPKDNKEDLFETDILQEEPQNNFNDLYNIIGLLKSIGRPSERQNNGINNYSIHI